MSEIFTPINLPSKCVQYVNKEVRIRPYKGEEENSLAQMGTENINAKYQVILERVLQGVKPSELTLGDHQYVILWEFINSYMAEIPVDFTCSHCLKFVRTKVNLNTINCIDPPAGFSVPYSLTAGDKNVLVRLMNMGDVVASQEYQKTHDDVHTYQYARTIVDDNLSIEAKMKLLSENLSLLARIRAWHEKYYFGPDMKVQASCKSCGKEDVVNIPFQFDFIYPSSAFLADAFGEGL
jgi:hypothetical protein